ncbi:MAG TPA: ribosome maturation factor RimM [Candidatus Binataceae bacterium]|nr:ribosome maturation factor RimM [Candidatus Binataceae bacterium]
MVQSPSEHNQFAAELIRIGYVSGIHGVRGALRVKLDNPNSDLLSRVQQMILARAGQNIECKVTGVQRAGRETFKVQVRGITDAENAAAFGGAVVLVKSSSLPATTAREFYYFQAIGCRVVTTSGLAVGRIEEVFSNGANDVWVIRDNLAEYLVPVIEDIVKDIDWNARQVTIEAVPGLLD